MSKLYVGNLPADINENALRQLFTENNLESKTILIKRGGYAFVDCADQTTADRAIDMLNGFSVFGSQIVVEPSVAGTNKKNVIETGGLTKRNGIEAGGSTKRNGIEAGGSTKRNGFEAGGSTKRNGFEAGGSTTDRS